jgi:hypothetical protein
MKKIILVIALGLVINIGFGQSVEKLIKEENVTRVIKTLTADDGTLCLTARTYRESNGIH